MRPTVIFLLASTSLAFARTPDSVIEGSVVNNWIQGGLAVTSRALDLGIQGQGFFVVEDNTGLRCFTRHGHFELAENGHLKHRGLDMDLISLSGDPLSLRGFSSWRGDALKSVRIELDGKVVGIYSNGYTRDLGRITLALFQNQRRLERRGHCLLPTGESGDPYIDSAQVDGRGSIYSHALEDLAEEIYSSSLD